MNPTQLDFDEKLVTDVLLNEVNRATEWEGVMRAMRALAKTRELAAYERQKLQKMMDHQRSAVPLHYGPAPGVYNQGQVAQMHGPNSIPQEELPDDEYDGHFRDVLGGIGG